MAGSTGTRTGTTAGHFRCPVPVPLPLISLGSRTLSSPEIWTGSRTGSTGSPEVPVTVALLPLYTSGGNFRRHFRLFFRYWMFWGLPVFGPEVTPVLPYNRKYRYFTGSSAPRVFSSSRWQAFSRWAGSTALWAGTTGPAGLFPPVYRWGAALCRAVVPPFGPVLPALRESEPNCQISQGTYLKGFLPQRFTHSCSLVFSLSSIVAHSCELVSSPSLR